MGEVLNYPLQRDEEDGFYTVGIPDNRLAEYAWQMFSGCAYLHFHKIVHRVTWLSFLFLASQAPRTSSRRITCAPRAP